MEQELTVNAAEILEQFDKESATRHYDKLPKTIINIMLGAFALYALWLNTFSLAPEQVRRTTFLGFVVILAIVLYPAKKGTNKRVNYLPWYDVVIAALGSAPFLYYAYNFRDLAARAGAYKTFEIVIAIIAILVLFEVCRRVVGVPILIVVTAFIIYAFTAGYSYTRITSHLFYTLEGVIGTPLGVCSTFIVLFILFGSFLDKTGVGKFFIDVANSIAGGSEGGPAKVAVIASGLQGMISGSSVANTVGSGSFTIPMMKKTGYKPEFAAAVEAAASTGGQIMPPIMGAAAFLMAEMTGVPYSNIVIAAIIPALLYFTGIFVMITFEAKKLGLKGMPKDQIPNFFKLMAKQGYLLLPLLVLVYCLSIAQTTPARAAVLAILTAIGVSMVSKKTRLTPKSFGDALINGSKSTISVAVACAVAGMIVGIVTLTGIGLTLASSLLALSGGIKIIALFFTMIACLILGMGVPTTANYVIMATITAPIVIKMGVPTLAAHMFVFYFGIVADITPPVALAAYAGSAIAHSDPFKTGVTATRLAITAFLVPYVFAFSPEMLLIDANIINVTQIILTSLVGIVGLASGMEGFMLKKLAIWERALLIAAGLMLIQPGTVTDIVGIGAIGAIAAMQYFSTRKQQAV